MNHIADLFCGGGGTSTGILAACADLGRSVNLLAVNHWQTAINTHSLNHPGVRHLCGRLENIKPHEAIPGGRLSLLAASPECTHHSIAAGGRPKNDQSRCQAWLVCDWLSALKVDALLIENVKEFVGWGRLTAKGKPHKRYKGEYFRAFLSTLGNMGYHVEWRIVNAADYGDPTSRRRLIMMARRGRKIVWPEASHGDSRTPWRTAREIIDWNLKGKSIFHRTKPLSENTLRRIGAGLRKFGGVNAEPFLVILNGTHSGQIPRTARSLDHPLPTQTTCGHIGLAQPFILPPEGVHRGNAPRSLGDPLQTVTQRGGGTLVEPFMVKFHGNHNGRRDGEQRVHETDQPIPTLDTSNRFGLCEPFLTHLTHSGKRPPHSMDEPVPTITTAHRGEIALIEPILLGQQSGHNGSPMTAPCPTVSTTGAIALVEPFLVKYYGTGTAQGTDEPLHTIATKDRFLLVEPRTGRAVAELDILFRMLQPHELAAAMSFPAGYRFTGNRGDQVKQIGNAVPVELARAHARALLHQT